MPGKISSGDLRAPVTRSLFRPARPAKRAREHQWDRATETIYGIELQKRSTETVYRNDLQNRLQLHGHAHVALDHQAAFHEGGGGRKLAFGHRFEVFEAEL